MLDVIPHPFLILLAVVVAVRLAWRTLVAHSRGTETTLNESERLSQRPARKHDATCIVAGAGVAGTLTAAVAALHFERVILVDPVASDGDAHAHIAQLDQAHTIGPMVLNCLRALWSRDTLDDEMRKVGGRTWSMYDCPPELITLAGTSSMSDISAPKTDDALATLTWLCLSRRAAQPMLRSLLQNHTPGVEVMQGKITGITYAKDEASTRRIDAVQVTTPTTTTTLPCALLIDCSGPSRIYRSLIPTAATAIKMDKYRMRVQYSTAYIDLHPSLVDRIPMTDEGRRRGLTYNDAGIFSLVSPALSPAQECFVMCRYERNALGMAIMSYKDKPQSEMPSTLDDYAAAYKDTHRIMLQRDTPAWFDDFFDVLRENEEVRGEKTKFVKLRDNESWCLDLRDNGGDAAHLPSNILLLGDTYCKLNPAFGAGCQKAASEVMVLHSVLLDHHAAAAVGKPNTAITITQAVRAFNKRRHAVTFGMFQGHRALDFSQPTVQRNNADVPSNTGQDIRFLTRGMWTWMAVKQDRKLTDTFCGVLMAGAVPPAMLMHPKNLFRILYGALCL